MSQANIDRVRGKVDTFNRTGEIDVQDLAPDFEMHQASSLVDTAGVFHGQDALHGALRELQEAFEELSFEAEEIIEAPDGQIFVLIRVRGRGRGSGMEIENRIAHVWTYRDDKAVRLVATRSLAKRAKLWD